MNEKKQAAFVVAGKITGKERPRLTRQGHAYTPVKTREYEKRVAYEYRRQCSSIYFGMCGSDKERVSIHIDAYYGIPKSYTKGKRLAAEQNVIRPTKKPDADNIAKIICDALNGVAYDDDAQLIHISVDKWYTKEPDSERVAVLIEG